MKKRYTFENAGWENGLIYAYGPQAKTHITFPKAENGIITVGYNESISDYDYISIITEKRVGIGTRVTLTCSYEGSGAPLIVFSESTEDKNGIPIYPTHFELVAYKNGLNAWRVDPNPARIERPIKSTKLLGEEFDVEEGSQIVLSALFLKGKVNICMNGKDFVLENPDFPEEFHVGFTACEGICKFESFEVEYEEG